MKVFLVVMLVVLTAATVLALGNTSMTDSVSAAAVQVVDYTSEPAALLLSGSLLLGLAGAVKRFTM